MDNISCSLISYKYKKKYWNTIYQTLVNDSRKGPSLKNWIVFGAEYLVVFLSNGYLSEDSL